MWYNKSLKIASNDFLGKLFLSLRSKLVVLFTLVDIFLRFFSKFSLLSKIISVTYVFVGIPSSSQNMWDKVFKNGLSKICGRQPLKSHIPSSFPYMSSIHFTGSILEYFAEVFAIVQLFSNSNFGSTKLSISTAGEGDGFYTFSFLSKKLTHFSGSKLSHQKGVT